MTHTLRQFAIGSAAYARPWPNDPIHLSLIVPIYNGAERLPAMLRQIQEFRRRQDYESLRAECPTRGRDGVGRIRARDDGER